MEKFFSPLRNSENDGGKALLEKNAPVDADPEEMEVIHGKLAEKIKVENKNVKLKKLKIKKCRGEKRKLPDKSDPKKIKRKKKEEKLQGGYSNSNENNEGLLAGGDSLSTPNNKLHKDHDLTPAENDSDRENSERPSRQKSSRKSKAVANKCRETFEILANLDSDVLTSMDKSLKLLKNNNLLNNKLISVDVLLELISLALGTNSRSGDVDCERELSLLGIISKCMDELSTTPKRIKARRSLDVGVSPKQSMQEEVPPPVPALKEDVLENPAPKIADLEETTEQIDANAEQSEKVEGPAVEKSGKNFCITNYFKKLKRTVEEKDKNERFGGFFTTKTDKFIAPKLGGELTEQRRKDFEDEFDRQNYESNYLSKVKRKKKSADEIRENKSNPDVETRKEPSQVDTEAKNCPSATPSSVTTERKRATLIRVDKPKTEPTEAVCRAKAKLFQFHDNRRPPYWGTWRKKSESVRPRRPFGKEKTFNYEVDSDDEWEEEEEPGESLHGSDDEKEPEEDYEVDNDFFVPHGYLSDDENPEKENLSPKTKLDLLEEQFTSEQKQKTRKMTPIVFGTFWVHNGVPSEGTLHQDLQIDRLQYVPWVATPVEIGEEDEKKCDNTELGEPSSQVKKLKQKIFPNEEIPNLIKMIHGSPQNANHLAKKFLLYWETEKIPIGNRPGLTKVCVQKKIKELAAWQASHEKGKMCWQVPKETREEFGAEVEAKTPEKKPRKCFIWKFVRKGGKDRATETPPASATPVEPEVIVLES